MSKNEKEIVKIRKILSTAVTTFGFFQLFLIFVGKYQNNSYWYGLNLNPDAIEGRARTAYISFVISFIIYLVGELAVVYEKRRK